MNVLKRWRSFGAARNVVMGGVIALLGFSIANVSAQTKVNGFETDTSGPTTSQPPAPHLTPAEKQMDAMVLSKMHQVNQLEIKMGELAMKKAQSKEVQAYGRRLRNDHQLGDRLVTQLAEREGLTLADPKPQTPEQEQKAQKQKMMSEKLESLEGPEFDKTFLNAMEQGHTQAIQMLAQAHEKLKDPQVWGLVGKMLPILEQHLQLAKDLENKTSGGPVS